MGVCHRPAYNKGVRYRWKVKMKGLKYRFRNTYSIIGDFVQGVDHAVVRESRFAEQMLLPFFPLLFVRLSNEEGRDPL